MRNQSQLLREMTSALTDGIMQAIHSAITRRPLADLAGHQETATPPSASEYRAAITVEPDGRFALQVGGKTYRAKRRRDLNRIAKQKGVTITNAKP